MSGHVDEQEKALGEWIDTIIGAFCSQSPENSLKMLSCERAWDEPLVGFSRGDDPLYLQFKHDIGDFFLTPVEVFEKAFPSIPVVPLQLTVVSWILPQTKATRTDNRKESSYPSERWARSRLYGENFNVILRDHVCSRLSEKGIETVAPLSAPFFSLHVSERYSLASNWSERHAAYVAGLGTFGLCDGIITRAGKAVRCGSVVARMSVPASERPYTHPREYCLHFSHGK